MSSPSALTPVHRGKIRELFATDDGRLVMVASDRISAYDHVLATPIPDKGRILTAMSVWWFEQLADVVPNHVLGIEDPVIPAEWRGRALVCRPLTMVPIEAVARGYLTGSGLVEYRAGGGVCGVALPDGLVDGSRLPEPIFTPATKAAIGEHDENIHFAAMTAAVGAATAEQVRETTLAVYTAAARIAEQRGIVLADTKLEFGHDADGVLTLGDEVLTPDSSRFWPAETWQPGRPQPSYDKQYLRDWLTGPESGWDRAGDAPPPALPNEVVTSTRDRYVQAYEQLTGQRFTDWLAP